MRLVHPAQTRARMLGQSFLDDLETLAGPVPGGVYTASTNDDGSIDVSYVDDTGTDQSTTLPAGTDIASAVSSLLPSFTSYTAGGLTTAAGQGIAQAVGGIPTSWKIGGGIAAVIGLALLLKK